MSFFNYIARKYEFDELETSLATEIVAGISLFLSLSYIFIVNPSILSQAGIPSGSVFFATVIVSAIFTLLMGFYAKLPFAVAPGLESSSFFTFVVVLSLGFTWQQALGLIFWSGVLCLIFTVVPIRQKIIAAIPEGLRTAIAASVGVFVLVIGLVVTDLLKFENGLPVGVGSFLSEKSILLYVGFLIAFVLGIKRLNFPAGMLVSIIICSVIANILGVTSETPPAEHEDFLIALGELELFSVFQDPRAWTIMLVFFMIDFYGSIGKFIGLTRQTNLAKIDQINDPEKALFVDSSATIAGSVLGTSTIITFVESAVAIGQGGRTGIVAIVCGLLMLLSLVFAPLVSIVPVAAVGGVLVYVGFLLQPRSEVIDALKGESDTDGTLSHFDLFAVIAMGAIAFFTFSLDKSIWFGFTIYTLKELFQIGGRVNLYLAGSTIILSIAMGYQYFAL